MENRYHFGCRHARSSRGHRVALWAGYPWEALLLPIFLALSLGFSPASGGEQAEASEQESVLATYDGGKITLAEFREAVSATVKRWGPEYDPSEYMDEILKHLATQEILEAEAAALGYADEEGLRDPEIIASKERVMVNTLRREVILTGVRVTEDEVKALYERGKTRRLTRAIVLSNKEDAEEVGRLLAEGADFVEMAQKWSLDLGSATWKGILGWVKPGDGPEDIENLIYGLPVGEIGGPVESARGYYFVKVDSVGESVDVPYEEVRAQYRTAVRKRKHSPVNIAYMDSVAQALDVRYDEKTIDLIIHRFADEGWVAGDEPGRRSRIPSFEPDELEMTVFTFEGGSRKLDEFLDFVKKRRTSPAFYLAGREELERGLQLFVHKVLTLHVAYELGMDEVASVRGHVRKKALEKGVISMLVEACGGEEANRPTEEGRREYYENHPHLYTAPGGVVVSMITILEYEPVDDLYMDAKDGVPFSQLESDYRWMLDEDRSGERIDLESGEDGSAISSEDKHTLLEVARRMEVGAVSEPIPMPDGGYTVMKLLEKEEGELLSYEEVRDEVSTDYNMQILTGAYKIMEDFKQNLREKYNYRVEEGALEAIKS